MSFRFLLQPLTACFFAFRDGRKDAHNGEPPYLWAIFTDRVNRGELIRSGLKSVGKIIVLALILDGIYQFRVLNFFYPGEALAVAFVLAIVPYFVLRGIVNRLTPRAGKVAKP
jgi:hypothetical protein